MLTLLAAALVSFPAASKEARSPTSSARVFYREHWRVGGQAHPVFYDDGIGHVVQVATVTRNMDVSWSADGRRFFIQDNLGSNAGDCYVVTPGKGTVRGVSLSALIQRTPGHPGGDERPATSHYYVVCSEWRSDGSIAGRVSGHTDRNPVRGFDYPFTFDAGRCRLRWVR